LAARLKLHEALIENFQPDLWKIVMAESAQLMALALLTRRAGSPEWQGGTD